MRARTYLSVCLIYMYILCNLIWMGGTHKLLETMVKVMVLLQAHSTHKKTTRCKYLYVPWHALQHCFVHKKINTTSVKNACAMSTWLFHILIN